VIRDLPEVIRRVRTASFDQPKRFRPVAARPYPVTSAQAGELREPILIGLIIAFGGPVLTKAIADVIKRFIEHKETMAKRANEKQAIENDFRLKLALVSKGGIEKPITLAELTSGQS
jgi:hypothetical protein